MKRLRISKRKNIIIILVVLVCLIISYRLGTKGLRYINSSSNIEQDNQMDKTDSYVAVNEPNQNLDSDNVNVMKVHFIDVGQADCILIESAGKFMLVDAGNNADAKTITNYLDNHGVTKLEYVIGTHPHEDHIGSLDTVIDNYDIGVVILPDVTSTTATFKSVLTSINNKGLSITLPVVGDSYDIGNASFTIIAPNNGYGSDYNNWSVGIKLINGNNSFVMCGDAELEAEYDIVSNGIDISADVLKCGHHGSNTSTTEALLKAIHPKYAVISVGENNTYGHPANQILERLSEYGVKTYRTDKSGTIVAISDGTNITLEGEH